MTKLVFKTDKKQINFAYKFEEHLGFYIEIEESKLYFGFYFEEFEEIINKVKSIVKNTDIIITFNINKIIIDNIQFHEFSISDENHLKRNKIVALKSNIFKNEIFKILKEILSELISISELNNNIIFSKKCKILLDKLNSF